MKLKVTIPAYTYLVLPSTVEVGPLLVGLAQGVVMKDEGYGDTAKVVVSEEKCKFELIDEDFAAEKTEPFKKLQQQLADSQSSWHDQYNRAQKAEKELKELQAKLEAAANAVA